MLHSRKHVKGRMARDSSLMTTCIGPPYTVQLNYICCDSMERNTPKKKKKKTLLVVCYGFLSLQWTQIDWQRDIN